MMGGGWFGAFTGFFFLCCFQFLFNGGQQLVGVKESSPLDANRAPLAQCMHVQKETVLCPTNQATYSATRNSYCVQTSQSARSSCLCHHPFPEIFFYAS